VLLPLFPSTSVAETCDVLDKLLSQRSPVQAIVTLNSISSIRTIEALDKLGVIVPQQLALIGFDDFELATVLRPRLTVVRQPGAELGICAAKLLFDRLESRNTSSPVTLSLPVTLVVRESCGCKFSP
jgi:LacI family transcriptional regulator